MTNRIDPMKRFCADKPHVRKGDHVLIAGAAEADLHTDDVFVAISDPWDLCGTEVVTLDYLESGKRYAPFATKFLAVIPESYRRSLMPAGSEEAYLLYSCADGLIGECDSLQEAIEAAENELDSVDPESMACGMYAEGGLTIARVVMSSCDGKMRQVAGGQDFQESDWRLNPESEGCE